MIFDLLIKTSKNGKLKENKGSKGTTFSCVIFQHCQNRIFLYVFFTTYGGASSKKTVELRNNFLGIVWDFQTNADKPPTPMYYICCSLVNF